MPAPNACNPPNRPCGWLPRTSAGFRRLIGLLGVVWIGVPAVADDVVTMKNGDRLTGKILTMGERPVPSGALVATLDLETPYAGVVHLLMPEVRSIESTSTVEVKLKSGEKVKGVLKGGAEQQIVVESPGVGATKQIPYGELAAFNEPPPPVYAWHGFVEAGGTARSGNNDLKTFTLGAQAARETPEDKFAARALFNYGEKDGLRTVRNGAAMAKYDYNLSPRSYVYGSTELFSDEFADLNLRVITGGGAGIRWLKTPSIQSFLEGGAAYLVEDFDLGPDDRRMTGRVSAGLNWWILNWLSFDELATYYPSFKEVEYLLHNEASLTATLSTSWSLRLGSVSDYNTDPPTAFVRRDSLWFAALQYRF